MTSATSILPPSESNYLLKAQLVAAEQRIKELLDTVALLQEKLSHKVCTRCNEVEGTVGKPGTIRHTEGNRKRGYSVYDTSTSSPYDSSIEDGDMESTINSSVPKNSRPESISDSDPDANASNNTVPSQYSGVKKYKPSHHHRVRLSNVIRTSSSSVTNDVPIIDTTSSSDNTNVPVLSSVHSSTDSVVTTLLPKNRYNDSTNNDEEEGTFDEDTSELSSAVSVLASTLKRGENNNNNNDPSVSSVSNEYISWNTYPSQQLHAYYNRNVPKDYRYHGSSSNSTVVSSSSPTVVPSSSSSTSYYPAEPYPTDPNGTMNNYYHYVPNNDYYYYYPPVPEHSTNDMYHHPSVDTTLGPATATTLASTTVNGTTKSSPRSSKTHPSSVPKHHPTEEEDDDNDENNNDYPEDAEIYHPRNESEYITMSDPVKALHAVKGKMVDQERQQVDYLIDLVKNKKLIVARGDLARMLQDKVNPSRPREFYEKLVSRKNLNVELAPYLTIRKVRRRRTVSTSVASSANIYKVSSHPSGLTSNTISPMVPIVHHRA